TCIDIAIQTKYSKIMPNLPKMEKQENAEPLEKIEMHLNDIVPGILARNIFLIYLLKNATESPRDFFFIYMIWISLNLTEEYRELLNKKLKELIELASNKERWREDKRTKYIHLRDEDFEKFIQIW